VDCSVSLQFGTEFDDMTSMYYNVQGQMSKVKVTAWKHRLIAK